ncbi:MAG: DNA polymerase III subunit gamma/tau [Candidatus Saccharimonadales bacterium]
MGKALYRRYRSKALSEIVGQSHITDILEKSLKSGKISHAYLFVGPRGTGKTSIARILAHEINGFDYELEDDYLDIIEIDAASNTGVDNIRDLREKAIIAPTKGKYKVYIIDEVHMLSKSAFNALLKTLEEPPEHVVFIMATTDAHKVPVTITSRSQSFVFKLADVDTMFAHLKSISEKEKIKINDGALRIVAKRSGGSFRDAISLLDQVSTLSDGEITEEVITKALGLPQDDLVQQLYEAYLNASTDEITGYLRQLAGQGVKSEIIAEELMSRIVENPYPQAMRLLEKLSDVPRAAYPEVKLLLALVGGDSLRAPEENLSGSRASLREKASFGVSSENTSGDAPVFTGHRPSRSAGSRGEARPSSAASSESPKEAPLEESSVVEVAQPQMPVEEAQEVPRELSSAKFDWNGLIEDIVKHAPTIKSFVQNSDYEYDDKQLTIYARNKFAKAAIDKKRDFIMSRIPDGRTLEVLAETKTRDPAIANILEIMGGGEEITL